VYLFDTCTLRCGYCWLAENGNVLDMRQLERFKEPAFLDRVTSFFLSRTTPREKWLLLLSGGEPLIAPNLSRLMTPLLEAGNRIGIYTALMVGRNHPGFRFLLENPYPRTDYVMASLHPEGEEDEAEFLEKIRMLKSAGHKVLVRYVAAPKRLHRLEELSERCRDLDVAFYPTTLFSQNYPHAYTAEEKDRLRAHFSTLSQHIQLEGGLDTAGLQCHGGSRLISVNLQTGDITPCITVHRPSIGNIFEDRLSLSTAPDCCPEPGIACVCDIHFQQDVVPGATDHSRFVQISGSFAPPRDYQAELATMQRGGIRLSLNLRIGIGEVRDDSRLFYTIDEVRERFRRARNQPRTNLSRKVVRELPAPLRQLTSCNSVARISSGIPVRITTAPGRWTWAASLPLAVDPAPDFSAWLRIRATVQEGEGSFGVLNRGGGSYQDRCFLSAGDVTRTVFLKLSSPGNASSLIVENSTADGTPAQILLHAIDVLLTEA
jgi:organic radical activating enzyme